MSSAGLGPRLVVAGTHSGVGKTTVATGLVAALRRSGYQPAAAKVGPDFIDPGYHALASGRPPRNIDAWLCGPDAVVPLAARAGAGCDVLVVEGVMGLFDGASDGTVSSTADVAVLLDAPVLLVVDASAMSESVAAVVHGFATLRPGVRVAAVVLNRVGSRRTRDHAPRGAHPGRNPRPRRPVPRRRFPVAGPAPRSGTGRRTSDGGGAAPGSLGRCRQSVGFDLEAVVALARSAPPRTAGPVRLPGTGPPIRVAVAGGAAFTFTYTDTLEALQAAGAEIVTFDPLQDSALPAGIDGLLIGGGFPEVHVGGLAANRTMLADVHDRVARGLPTWAECGGLLLLSASLDGRDLAGVIPAAARMTDRLTLGYREAVVASAGPIGGVGTSTARSRIPLLDRRTGWRRPQSEQQVGSGREGWATEDHAGDVPPPSPRGRPGSYRCLRRHLCPTSYPTSVLDSGQCARAASISRIA